MEELKRYYKTQSKFKDAEKALFDKIKGKVNFEIYLNYFPDDGLCVMHGESQVGITIGEFLRLTARGKKLTEKEFIQITVY